jgi:hypothetical protein
MAIPRYLIGIKERIKVKPDSIATIKVPNTNHLGLLLGIFSKTAVLSTFFLTF